MQPPPCGLQTQPSHQEMVVTRIWPQEMRQQWLHHLAVETRAYMSSTARGGWDTGGTGSGQAWFDFRSACKTDAEVGLSDKVVLLKGWLRGCWWARYLKSVWDLGGMWPQ